MKNILYFLIIFLIIPEIAIAQKFNRFSGDPLLFPEEVKEYLGENVSKDDEEFMEMFLEYWVNDSIGSERKQEILEISNLFIDKRARAIPGYLKYLKLIDLISKHNFTASNYQEWLKSLTYLLNERKITRSQVNQYIDITSNLLTDTSIYAKTTLQWKSNQTNYQFKFDKEPLIIFSKTDLFCFAKRSQIEIYDTKGIFKPLSTTWEGDEGIVTWERAGYDKNNVFAKLSKYTIDMSKPEYTADSVVFTNTQYFDEPLLGNLHDKVKYISESIPASYPQFDTYIRNFSVDNLYEGIQYDGGFSMRGEKLVGISSENNLSQIIFFKSNSDTALVARSEFFSFRPDRITSNICAVNIPIEVDSIYHPSVFLSFNVAKRELSLSHNESALSMSPIFNTYHNVDMGFEQLIWEIDKPNIRFALKRGSAMGTTQFESVNYFNMGKYEQMQRYDFTHPLAIVRRYSDRKKSETFSAMDLAKFTALPVHEIRIMLLQLAISGFVDYDIKTDIVLVKPRLYSFMKASVGKIDYDVISFSSNVQSPNDNAQLNLENYDLKINGIPQIFLSDSQNVVLYPKGNTITLKRNRDFDFDGTVRAGLFTFYGDSFRFDYETFKIDLTKVDSLNMDVVVDERKGYDSPLLAQVNNTLENISGELLIDKPNNKSGRESHSEYPIFNSLKNSFVYYDDPSVQNGVYRRDSFYFEIYPYTIDSLDNFNKDAMVYNGKFKSGSIFPEFEEAISLQEDFSLGFVRQAPNDGFPVYLGTGRYYDTIRLSNDGLRGGGRLEYLTSNTQSSDFVFYIDSMNTYSNNFDIASQTKGIEFPQVTSTNNYVHWLPYEDQLFAKQEKEPFDMYYGKGILHGRLTLEPTGLLGRGRMVLENAELHSRLFKYNEQTFDSDSAGFYLKAAGAEDFTFLAEDVNAHIDYKNQRGLFRANKGATKVDFTENLYTSYLQQFTWFMDEERIEMGQVLVKDELIIENIKEVDLDESKLPGSRFISTHKGQDSLSFVSPTAYYSLKDNIIDARLVRFIKVADAAVFPDNGHVVVGKTANMRKLENSRILADTASRYHEVYEASTKILARNEYYANGKYDYIDERMEVQQIDLDTVFVENSISSGRGKIIQIDDFTLSPVYHYQGKFELLANREHLFFDGYTKIQHSCDIVKSEWLGFETVIDPNNIFIPVSDKPREINQAAIYNAIYLTNDSTHVYPSFLSYRKLYSDNVLATADGYLHYHRNSNQFRIGAMEKILNPDTTGNLLSFHKDYCLFHGEGKLGLGVKFGQMTVEPYGSLNYSMEKDETTSDLVLVIDFFFGDMAMNFFATDLKTNAGLAPSDNSKKVFRKAINDIMTAEKAKAYFDEISLFGSVEKLPEELKHTMILRDIELKWEPITGSYRYIGDIGILNLGEHQINKKVKGGIEIIKKRSGDIMHVLFQLDKDNWYIFSYTRGNLMTFSSNQEYVNTIKDTKLKERKMKVGRGKTPFIYMVSTDRRRSEVFDRLSADFVERMKQAMEPPTDEGF